MRNKYAETGHRVLIVMAQSFRLVISVVQVITSRRHVIERSLYVMPASTTTFSRPDNAGALFHGSRTATIHVFRQSHHSSFRPFSCSKYAARFCRCSCISSWSRLRPSPSLFSARLKRRLLLLSRRFSPVPLCLIGIFFRGCWPAVFAQDSSTFFVMPNFCLKSCCFCPPAVFQGALGNAALFPQWNSASHVIFRPRELA